MKKRMLSMAVVAAAFLCFGSDASAQKTPFRLELRCR